MYKTWSEVKWNEEKCEKQHTQKIMWFPSEYKTNLKRIKRSHEPFGVKTKKITILTTAESECQNYWGTNDDAGVDDM